MINSTLRRELAVQTEAPVTPEMLQRFQNPETIRILHAAMGLSTEAGELLDNLKKHLFYGKDIDKVNLMEEMGDLDWYLNLLCHSLDITMDVISLANVQKLAARYGGKFSEHRAVIRDLRKELEELKTNLRAGSEKDLFSKYTIPDESKT